MKRINKSKKNTTEIIITIILVTNNDEKTIKENLEELHIILSKNYENYEILIVDNDSLDETVSNIRKLNRKIPNVKIIRLSKESSTDIAYTAGLDNCIGDYAVLIDSRIVSPIIIPDIINQLIDNSDIVIGKSYKTITRFSFSKLFLTIIEKLSTHGFSYEPVHLLGLNRKAINSITRMRRKSRNLSYIVHAIGYRKHILFFKPLKGVISIKAPNFFETIIIVVDIVISNSFKPIRILAGAGMFISFLFLLYVIFVVLMAIVFQKYFAPKGWVTLASVIGAMFFLLFSILTLISEYIIRILNESRNEPLYFIADEMDKSVINFKKNKLNVV